MSLGESAARRDLVEHRLEEVVVPPVDQRHLHVGARQPPGQVQAGKAAADHDDMRTRGGRCRPSTSPSSPDATGQSGSRPPPGAPPTRLHRRCTSASGDRSHRARGGRGPAATTGGAGRPTRSAAGRSRVRGEIDCPQGQRAEERGPGTAESGIGAGGVSAMPGIYRHGGSEIDPTRPILHAYDHGRSLPHPLAQWRAEFPILERTTYLNSCSLGALSRASRRRIEAHLDQWETARRGQLVRHLVGRPRGAAQPAGGPDRRGRRRDRPAPLDVEHPRRGRLAARHQRPGGAS